MSRTPIVLCVDPRESMCLEAHIPKAPKLLLGEQVNKYVRETVKKLVFEKTLKNIRKTKVFSVIENHTKSVCFIRVSVISQFHWCAKR